MRESCFCGRCGDVEDRTPVLDFEGGWALRCPDCGHTDYLGWLSEENGLLLWGEAERRRLARHEQQPGQRPAA
ncbi:MAG: hypothetical protein H0V53_10370 [Rubrobacter sp.]|nr:hypothetical protein [Rubrobacter sp.]